MFTGGVFDVNDDCINSSLIDQSFPATNNIGMGTNAPTNGNNSVMNIFIIQIIV